MKKAVSIMMFLSLTIMLMLDFGIHVGSAGGVPFNKDHIVIGIIWMGDTVDPATAYDSASQELIFNVYEPLIFYAVNRSDPPAQAGKVDQFVPYLSTTWEISSYGETYIFKIREGVKFHNNETLTAEDVEYSFERIMVQDMGPAWLFYEPLLGVWSANLSDIDWMQKIDNTVVAFTNASGNYVQFNLRTAYAPFMNVLAQYGFIVNKAFVIAHGGWDGQHTYESLLTYHSPEVSPLDSPEHVMCGTGPFKLDYWDDRGYDFGEWSIVRNPDYWQGWPAPVSMGYVERATAREVGSGWTSIENMFRNGTLDIIPVPRQYIEQAESLLGIRYIKDLPGLTVSSLFFTFDIDTTSPYMGVPGGLPPSTFDETGIPPNFFNDTDLRKGFAYSFNWTRYINDELSYKGEATQPATAVIEGLPYRNPDQEKYYLNLTKAEEYFRTAWDGQVWEKGFTMTIPYLISSIPRYIWIEAFKYNVERLNPKFHINMVSVTWSTYMNDLAQAKLPIFSLGWLGDYPDPHGFVMPFMHSEDYFPQHQRYSNPIVDVLVEEGLHTSNKTRRREIYYELQDIYHNDCPSFPMAQPLIRHWERNWVQGWYYNQGYPGIYFYHLWKQPAGDLNMDGVYNYKDANQFRQAYVGEYNYLADFNLDGVVNYEDVALFRTYYIGTNP